MATLRERMDKLEPRERRLLTVFGSLVVACVFLLLPFVLFQAVSTKRSDNQEIRDLIQSIHEAEGRVAERKARHDALLARYAKPAPPLAGFIEDSAKQFGLAPADFQDRPDIPHGKRYSERVTVVKMHKVGMMALAKTIEHIENAGHPVAVTKLSIKPRAGEPDSFEVELGVSAFDRKSDPAPAPASSAAPASEEEGREP